VTTPDQFSKLDALEIQEIFCNRHILISGDRMRNSSFDRLALSKLGSLSAQREIQGTTHDKYDNKCSMFNPSTVNCKRTVARPDQMLHSGTLLDLLPSPKGKKQRGLNVLAIPMGGSKDVSRVRCFNHVIALVAKQLICQFDVSKGVADDAGLDDVEQTLRELAKGIDNEEYHMQAEQDADNDEDSMDKGGLEELNLSHEELDKLDENTWPVKLVLVKFSFL
jgi:hypothetical protein